MNTYQIRAKPKNVPGSDWSFFVSAENEEVAIQLFNAAHQGNIISEVRRIRGFVYHGQPVHPAINATIFFESDKDTKQNEALNA